MQIEQSIRRQLIQGYIFITIGISSLVLGGLQVIDNYMMLGIAVGFIPVGIGTIIIMKRAQSSKTMRRNIEIEQDERNQYIRNHAGARAFWLTYWIVFTLVIITQIISGAIDTKYVLIGLLISMPIIYFSLWGWGMNKY